MVKHDIVYSYSRPGRLRQISDWALPILVFVAAAFVYMNTMAPSVFWDDSAAFATTNFTLGISHSPSFPLYTLFGRLFNLIPNVEPAYSSNLMSVFFAALSVMLFFIIMKQFAEVPILLGGRIGKKLGGKAINLGQTGKATMGELAEINTLEKPAIVIVPCLAATTLFAISLPVWLSAVRAEVYSLHLFLSLTAMAMAFRGIAENKNRIFFLGLWVYALSYANHPLLALAFAPAFFYLLMINLPNIGYRPVALFAVLLLFAASFSIYFYLPIRSALNPSVNWGRPDNMNSFVAALTRSSDMSNFTQMVTSPDYLLRLRKVGDFLSGQIGWPLIGLSLFGLWGVFRISRKLFLFFPIAIFCNLAVIVWAADFNIRNYDLINYLAPLVALVIIVSTAGLLYLMRTRIIAGQASFFLTILLAVIIYLTLPGNRARADLSQANAPRTLCQEVLKDIPDGSVLIVAEDDLLLPLWYSAYVDSTARNIKILSGGAMLNAAYRKQLTINYPDLKLPADFTDNKPMKVENLVSSICRLNTPIRPVYVQFGVPGIEANDILPAGVVFKYTGKSEAARFDQNNYATHLNLVENMLGDSPEELRTIDFVGRWMFNIGVYCDRVGAAELAWQSFNKALNIDNENIDMRLRLASALARSGKIKEALQYVAQALELDPNDPNSLQLGKQLLKVMEKKGMVADNE
jgi:tetratricopeptide (TPR) repeat protein